MRVEGVSDASPFGNHDHSMRIWLDPTRLTSLELTADDMISAIREQNIQAAAGSIGTAPLGKDQQVQYTLRVKGRLSTVEAFRNVVVQANARGGRVHLSDVARVELGSEAYASEATMDGNPGMPLAI